MAREGAARLATAINASFVFGYAAGGKARQRSYINTAYSDEGSHSLLKIQLSEIGSNSIPIDLVEGAALNLDQN